MFWKINSSRYPTKKIRKVMPALDDFSVELYGRSEDDIGNYNKTSDYLNLLTLVYYITIQ